jgi:stage V sporulation protein B
MGFNVYVANTAGAEAVGLYSLLSSVYGFAVTLALSGLHLAVTRLVSEALAINDKPAVSKVMRKCFFYAFAFGTLSMILLFLLSKTLAAHWLGEIRAERPLKILAFCLPLISISSVINGYFSAVRRVFKSAVSQLCEMSVKIIATVSLFSLILKRNAELACILLVCGSAISELFIFVINIVFYLYDRLIHFKKKDIRLNASKKCENTSRKILGISLPVAFTSYVRSALLSIEHSLIPKGLQKFGNDRSDALASYGTLSSMALPVINFPYALIGSFSSLLIPEVAECRARGENRHVRYIAYRTYQSGISFAVCVFGIFFLFAAPLGHILYSSSDAALYIKYLAPLVPIMYTDSVTDAILKGMGEQFYAMKVNIADAFISVFLVYFLVPIYGIYGYIVTIYIAEIINAALSIFRMIKVTGLRPPIIKFLLCPLACTAGAASICNILGKTVASPNSVAGLVFGIILYVLIYMLAMFCIGGFSKDDVFWIKSIFSKK